MRSFRVLNVTQGTVASEHADAATSPWSRFWGLMGRKRLADGRGLHIVPCSSIHTGFMRFDMDAVFLDRQNCVTRVVKRMRPFRVAFGHGAHSVLEFPGGWADVAEIKEGDQLQFIPLTEASP